MNEKVAFFNLDEIAESAIATSSAVKAPAPKPVTRAAAQPKKEAALVRKAAAGNGKRSGPVGRMQAGLATAVAEDRSGRSASNSPNQSGAASLGGFRARSWADPPSSARLA